MDSMLHGTRRGPSAYGVDETRQYHGPGLILRCVSVVVSPDDVADGPLASSPCCYPLISRCLCSFWRVRRCCLVCCWDGHGGTPLRLLRWPRGAPPCLRARNRSLHHRASFARLVELTLSYSIGLITASLLPYACKAQHSMVSSLTLGKC